LVAFLLLLIPGIIATLGIKLMRDSIFLSLHWPFTFVWLQCIVGFIMFSIGLFFIAGFIFHRDKKRKKVTNRRLSR
jgi:hypothetical protein